MNKDAYKEYINVDMDGVLCEELPTFNRSIAAPNKKAIELVNKLSEDYYIRIFTARSWAEYDMTAFWLFEHNVVFHQLICGKPIAKYTIDDRASKTVEELWTQLNPE